MVLVWWWCQEILPKNFGIIVLKSHFSMVITQTKKKILVCNRSTSHEDKSQRIPKGLSRVTKFPEIVAE